MPRRVQQDPRMADLQARRGRCCACSSSSPANARSVARKSPDGCAVRRRGSKGMSASSPINGSCAAEPDAEAHGGDEQQHVGKAVGDYEDQLTLSCPSGQPDAAPSGLPALHRSAPSGPVDLVCRRLQRSVAIAQVTVRTMWPPQNVPVLRLASAFVISVCAITGSTASTSGDALADQHDHGRRPGGADAQPPTRRISGGGSVVAPRPRPPRG